MRRFALTILIASGTLSSATGAQSLAADCVRDSVEELHSSGPWAALRPREVSKRFAALRTVGKWSTLPDSLRAIYSLAPADLSTLAPVQNTAINAELDSLRIDLTAAEQEPSRFAKVRARFPIQFDPGPPVGYTLFYGLRTAQTTVTAATPEDTRRSVCWLGLAAQDLIRQAQLRAITEVSAALNELDATWDNFMNRGYSMLPHEVLINGFIKRPLLTPPRFQVIVVHPSAGTQIVSESWSTLRESHREDVLTLEPLGVIMYGSHHRSYRGLSWLVTFPSTARIGSGLMVHAGRLAQIAYVWRPVDADGKRRNGLLMSIDVYRYLGGAADQWKRAKAAAVTRCEELEKLCPKTLLK